MYFMKIVSKNILFSILFIVLSGVVAWAGGAQDESLNLWTQEGTAEGAYKFVVSLAEAYGLANPDAPIISVLNKDTEALREDFQNASLVGEPPHLLWTVNDHAGPFVTADLIQPVDQFFDLSQYVESVVLNGQTWGVPISSGNHLMLLYNKSMIASPPETTDELLTMGASVSDGVDTWGIVWNQIEPFWLVPWLGGFGGRVFQDDGISPSLNTPAMVDALAFLLRLKEEGITPQEVDYDGADTLFKEGRAAMIINGDWSLGDYQEAMGDNLGIARLPRVSSTGRYPAPYTSGKYFMIPKDITDEQRDVVIDFVKFATNYDNQIAMVAQLTRLPALLEALNDESVVSDAILQGSSEQIAVGTPMPSVIEMRCNWDAMKPQLNAVLAGTTAPSEAAESMQAAADACIAEL